MVDSPKPEISPERMLKLGILSHDIITQANAITDDPNERLLVLPAAAALLVAHAFLDVYRNFGKDVAREEFGRMIARACEVIGEQTGGVMRFRYEDYMEKPNATD